MLSLIHFVKDEDQKHGRNDKMSELRSSVRLMHWEGDLVIVES